MGVMTSFLKKFTKDWILGYFSPDLKRKKPDTEPKDDAEPPQKRPSTGEAPQQPAAAALPGKMSQPSANAFVNLQPRVWRENLPAPVAATQSRTRGRRRPASPRWGPAPPPAPLIKPNLESERRDAACPPPQRAVPLPQPPLEQQSPEEKALYEENSLFALRATMEQREAGPKSGAAVDTQQHYMSILYKFQQGRFDSEMDLYSRDEGHSDVGSPLFRTGRTVAEQADLAKQNSVLQDRMTKAASQRASVVVRESQEAAKKNKEKEQIEIKRMEALTLKVAKVPDITNEDRSKYKQLIAAAEAALLVSHPRSKIEIKGHDMRTLSPGAWLNDEVINLSISLLQERDKRWREAGAAAPTCHYFNSFFLNKLYKDSGKYNYNDVRRWTMPVRLKNAGQLSASVLDCDRIIIPANQGNTHWVCAMADLKNKKFVLFDSLGGEDKKCLENLAQYVKDEYKNKKDEERDDVLSWPREFPKDIPRQANGYDCGMFTILFAEYCGKGAALNFSQKNIDDFRVRIVRDIMRLKID